MAYLLNTDLSDLKKPLYLIALGGNQQMNAELITIVKEDLTSVEKDIEDDFIFRVEVFKANWFTLLSVISDIQKQLTRQEYFQSDTKSNLRIIEDAIRGCPVNCVIKIIV
ncbi:hypothetical protein VSO92_12655 [Myroides pelagicus]|uniref:hypothetical protein n=1 Tax=Myroides pelagicus TaxID=270914 RepID=UPI002DBA0C13|nr:hypothetical protein [Myroides pelagicus]MEC4114953.1 hypothetical protein [Myroides pelagicus]